MSMRSVVVSTRIVRRRGEEERAEGVLPSASDDEVGGL